MAQFWSLVLEISDAKYKTICHFQKCSNAFKFYNRAVLQVHRHIDIQYNNLIYDSKRDI